MVYALLGIPIVASCLGYLAAQLLGQMELHLLQGMPAITAAFAKYDADASGQLSLKELRSALKDLEIELSDMEFRALVAGASLSLLGLATPLHSGGGGRSRRWRTYTYACTWRGRGVSPHGPLGKLLLLRRAAPAACLAGLCYAMLCWAGLGWAGLG